MFQWTDDCVSSFSRLRSVLVAAPVLAYPESTKTFIIDTDASNVGLGAVLSQEGLHGEQVVAYYSHSLGKPEKNYCVTRRELWAVVMGLRHFCPYQFCELIMHHTPGC